MFYVFGSTEDGDILVLDKCSKAYNFIEIKIKSSHSNQLKDNFGLLFQIINFFKKMVTIVEFVI